MKCTEFLADKMNCKSSIPHLQCNLADIPFFRSSRSGSLNYTSAFEMFRSGSFRQVHDLFSASPSTEEISESICVQVFENRA